MDAINYQNGQKNHWRRVAWNVISKRVSDPKNSIVVYLPGSTDLDRAEAIRRGFMPANLIAVERDPRVAESLRRKGVTVVVGELTKVLCSWPTHTPINVVIADFQCGISSVVEDYMQAWNFHPALSRACTVVNVQRGRDPLASRYLEASAGLYERSIHQLDVSRYVTARFGKHSSGKNRGEIVAFMGMERIARVQKDRFSEAKRIQTRVDNLKVVLEGEIAKLAQGFCPAITPQEMQRQVAFIKLARDNFKSADTPTIVPLPSYKSTKKSPVFDSVFLDAIDETYRRLPDMVAPIMGSLFPENPHKRDVSAALALRTRRLRGELRA